ncbi:glycosyltransferase family 2 protein [Klebsiella pneumoniae]|uniref:Glycosyltransferase n=12 Tax=Klebsiella pneumoniae TaxID=573 RepID=A0A4S4QG23_KLEPN|nr:glycosyltransferase family 2 protein [Klebsiella pneumoniae]MBT9346583.1 glycosyltransferase family 2 protein [Providencia stuartii]AKJ75384.1 putative glycosyltransferase [Klebsiella pneumoniae]ARS98988.1 glycosyl transferase family 2 [Klebsiella pneumoniae]ASC25678.1 glycosyl transferase family 2 [Klebsiella pneumoniae]AXN76349.1 glycosyltransferase [Klebsiella pneumoniae subsp. pneumoniae]
MEKVDVILASYNGDKYIAEQIRSILSNFDKLAGYDCRLLISDDSSNDNTIEVINTFVENDERITIVNMQKKGGVKENFYHLIVKTDADYVFFSDQDDFWLPDKMRIFLERFKILENDHTADVKKPILIHSDLCVADNVLSPVHRSMFSYQKLNKNPTFAELLVSNSVTGCVMACNKSLIEIAKKNNLTNAIMHDWYIGLLASCYGQIDFIDKPMILYRQHDNNQVGAKEFTLNALLSVENVISILRKAKQSVRKTKEQAELFLFNNSSIMTNERKILESYISSFNKTYLARAKLFFTGGIRKNGFLRNLMFFFIYVFVRLKD